MAITEQGALNDFYNMQPNISVEIVGNTAIFTAEINYAEEERQQTHCSSCNKITNSSRADYQNEFTCNDCGAEVQEEE